MHIPTTTPLGGIAPVSGADLALHDFVHVSWHVLMPYTLFGAGLMAYSQARLLRGQRALKKESVITLPAKTLKV